MWWFKSKALRNIESRLNIIEKELEQSKCEHKNINFKNVCYFTYDYQEKHTFLAICNECNKKLNRYKTEQEFNSAKVAYLRKQADELEAE